MNFEHIATKTSLSKTISSKNFIKCLPLMYVDLEIKINIYFTNKNIININKPEIYTRKMTEKMTVHLFFKFD